MTVVGYPFARLIGFRPDALPKGSVFLDHRQHMKTCTLRALRVGLLLEHADDGGGKIHPKRIVPGEARVVSAAPGVELRPGAKTSSIVAAGANARTMSLVVDSRWV